MDADAEGDHMIHLRCEDDASVPQTAMANRILVEADFPVSAIVPYARTLEDVYHHILAPASSGERLAA